jgi:hypothetical protein
MHGAAVKVVFALLGPSCTTNPTPYSTLYAFQWKTVINRWIYDSIKLSASAYRRRYKLKSVTKRLVIQYAVVTIISSAKHFLQVMSLLVLIILRVFLRTAF